MVLERKILSSPRGFKGLSNPSRVHARLISWSLPVLGMDKGLALFMSFHTLNGRRVLPQIMGGLCAEPPRLKTRAGRDAVKRPKSIPTGDILPTVPAKLDHHSARLQSQRKLERICATGDRAIPATQSWSAPRRRNSGSEAVRPPARSFSGSGRRGRLDPT